MADSLSGELYAYLMDTLYCVPATERKRSQWVMSAEWFTEVRKMHGPDGRPLWEPSLMVTDPGRLLGLPITTRAAGGAPHLEPCEHAQAASA